MVHKPWNKKGQQPCDVNRSSQRRDSHGYQNRAPQSNAQKVNIRQGTGIEINPLHRVYVLSRKRPRAIWWGKNDKVQEINQHALMIRSPRSKIMLELQTVSQSRLG